MNKIAVALITASALLSAPALHARERASGEEKLSKLLEGREAGEPQSCLPYGVQDQMQVIDKTAIVYGRGNTIWVNRPDNARDLDRDDILVRKSYTPRMCKLDMVTTHSRTGYFYTGFIALNDFVPYRKVARAD